ncbi:MAG: EamA family transporter [Clostridia bacterium]
MKMYIPVIAYLVASTLYQIIAKTMPSSINPFAMLTLVYGIASLLCFGLVFFTKNGETLGAAFSPMPLNVIFLGIVVAALEASTFYAYRLGWKVSVFPVLVYVCIILIMLFVGALLFSEKITFKKILGVVLCIAGLICMRLK